MELHLQEGVTIKAIQDDSQYPERETRIAGFEMEWPSALINIYEQENVRITGKGTIDGNGKYWWDKFWGDPPRSGGMWVDYERRNVRWAVDYDCKRVRPVVVYKSKDVLLKEVTIKRAGFWTVSLTYSNRVHVDGLIIRNNIGGFGPSSDGINSDSSSDILVENCDIDCNDDNLCIKAGRDADGLRVNRPAENIVYRHCITRSGHGLFTIGSETSGGVRNVEVYGLEAIGTNTGIRFKSAQVRGGLIENISFHDIQMKQVKSPFHFELNWYPEYSYPKIPDEIPEDEIPDRWRLLTQPVVPPEKGIPEFKNISLSNIEVKAATTALYANAYPEKPIKNLKWHNITIEAEKGGALNFAENWNFDQVIISLPDEQRIALKGCNNIALPDSLLKTITNDKSKLNQQHTKAEAIAQKNKLSIIAYNPDVDDFILMEDSTTFSKAIYVYIFTNEKSSFNYIEPLGDGFYSTPVSIRYNLEPQTIEVIGEKEHDWIFNIYMEKTPKVISGANVWEFDEKNHYLTIRKTASRSKIVIK